MIADPFAAAGCFVIGALLLVITIVLALLVAWPYPAVSATLSAIFIITGALYLRGDATG